MRGIVRSSFRIDSLRQHCAATLPILFSIGCVALLFSTAQKAGKHSIKQWQRKRKEFD